MEKVKASMPVSSTFHHNMKMNITINSQLYTSLCPEAGAYSEYCCQNCSAGIKAVWLHTISHELRWLQVRRQIVYKLAMIMFKICCIATCAYSVLSHLITLLIHISSVMRQSALLYSSTVVCTILTFQLHTISTRLITITTLLLLCASSVTAFKDLLKTHLFIQSYYST